MDDVIPVTPEEHALLRAALQGPLRPLNATERQACNNLAGRRLLSRHSSFSLPRGLVTDFPLSCRGWAYLKSHRRPGAAGLDLGLAARDPLGTSD